MKLVNIILMAVIVTVSAGCATNGNAYRGSREVTGGLAGAALGGLLGAQFGGGKGQLASTAAGVLIGGLIGSEVGRSMDEVDRMRANQAITRAHTAPIGERITWNNPNNNHRGSVTPTRDGYTDDGRYCREFHQTITIGGRSEEGYGIACRQENGDWRIVQR